MKMQLSEIARALEIEAKETWEDITITSVSFDSRQLEPGAFICATYRRTRRAPLCTSSVR